MLCASCVSTSCSPQPVLQLATEAPLPARRKRQSVLILLVQGKKSSLKSIRVVQRSKYKGPLSIDCRDRGSHARGVYPSLNIKDEFEKSGQIQPHSKQRRLISRLPKFGFLNVAKSVQITSYSCVKGIFFIIIIIKRVL